MDYRLLFDRSYHQQGSLVCCFNIDQQSIVSVVAIIEIESGNDSSSFVFLFLVQN